MKLKTIIFSIYLTSLKNKYCRNVFRNGYEQRGAGRPMGRGGGYGGMGVQLIFFNSNFQQVRLHIVTRPTRTTPTTGMEHHDSKAVVTVVEEVALAAVTMMDTVAMGVVAMVVIPAELDLTRWELVAESGPNILYFLIFPS